jgi:hypothetical protein
MAKGRAAAIALDKGEKRVLAALTHKHGAPGLSANFVYGVYAAA